MIRLPFDNQIAWLEEKRQHISASEISIVIGNNPWGNIDELYDIKVGLREPKYIGEEPQIIFGVEAEPIVRNEFSLIFKDRFQIEHHPYDILCHDNYPFISATLDGELTDLRTGEYGVWECKTTTVRTNSDLIKWNGIIPPYYFSQICTQLFVTKWSFGILTAKIIHYGGRYENGQWIDDEFPTIHTRNYKFDTKNPVVKESILYVAQKGIAFWRCVQNRQRPPLGFKPLRGEAYENR